VRCSGISRTASTAPDEHRRSDHTTSGTVPPCRSIERPSEGPTDRPSQIGAHSLRQLHGVLSLPIRRSISGETYWKCTCSIFPQNGAYLRNLKCTSNALSGIDRCPQGITTRYCREGGHRPTSGGGRPAFIRTTPTHGRETMGAAIPCFRTLNIIRRPTTPFRLLPTAGETAVPRGREIPPDRERGFCMRRTMAGCIGPRDLWCVRRLTDVPGSRTATTLGYPRGRAPT
jgi:hypothetical protein